MISKKRLKLSLKIIFPIVVIYIIFVVLPSAFSRYQSISDSNTNVDIAFYIVSSSMTTENLIMNDIAPSDDPYIYTFTVSNFEDDKRIETKATYNISINSTTNIPFVYEFYNANHQLIGSTEQIIQDDDGMYFRKITTSDFNFDFNTNQTDLYQLYIYYPEIYNNYENQNLIENISITIDSKQVIDE